MHNFNSYVITCTLHYICYYGHKHVYILRMRRHPHALNLHCCLIKWADQGVVYPFDYPAYSVSRPASGTKVFG